MVEVFSKTRFSENVIATQNIEIKVKESSSLIALGGDSRIQSTAFDLTSPDAARVLSLDAVRGFALCISFIAAPLVLALRNVPSSAIRDMLIHQMTHGSWDGMTFYDIGWAAYLFGTGISLSLAFARRVQRGQTQRTIFADLFRKFVLCLMFAFFFDGGFSVPLKEINFASLFFFYGFAVLVTGTAQLFLGVRSLLTVVCLLVIGYSIATLWGTHYCYGTIYQQQYAELDLIAERFLGSRLMAQYLWHFPRMMISCLIGVLVGRILLSSNSPQHKVWYFAGIGCGLMNVSWLLDIWIPMNMHLWTTSYAMCSSGAACLFFTAFYQIVDVWRVRCLAMPWVVFGANPLVAWAAFHLIPFDDYARRFVGYAFLPILGSYNGVLLAIVRVGLCWLCFYGLYRRRILVHL